MARADLRKRRHFRQRKFLSGTPNRPRLSVYRSGKYIYAQIIDDVKRVTLVAQSDLKLSKATKQDKAFEVGKRLAEKALKQGIKAVVFDRGGFLYHGRVAKLASGARQGGLEF